MFGAFIIICSIFLSRFPACIGWISCLLFLLRSFADPSYLRLHVWKRISDSPFSAFVLNQLSTALFYVGLLALAFMLKDTVGVDGCEAQISLSVEKGWWKLAQLSDPLTFTVTRNTMEGTFSVMVLAVFYSGEAKRSVCGSHAALSYVNQFLLLATGLCFTPCTFIIPSNAIHGLSKGDTACAGIDLVTCNDYDKVEIVLLYVSTTADMALFGTMIVAFGRSDSCSKNSCMFSEYTNSDALLNCASEGDVFLCAGCYTTVAIWILVTSWYIYNKKLRCHPHTFTVSRNTMEGTFSVMIFAVSYSGEAGRSVCGSHAALSYVNQFLLLATGLCLTPCTFIIPSNTIYGLGKGDTACAGIDLVTCNDCDKVEIGLLYVSTTTDMDVFGTMIVAFGRSDSCSKNSCMFSEYTNSDALLHCASEGDVFLRAGCYTTVAIWILVTSWYIYNKKLRCHPHTFTVSRNTMEGTFSVMIFAVSYSGEAGRSVCGSHAALSYVNQFLLLATGLCLTPCTFIIPSNQLWTG